MREFGLIGYPLSHSFSPAWFAEKFAKENIPDCTYSAFPLTSIKQLPLLLHEHPNLSGLNVTIPYKEAVIPYLTSIEDAAKHIGAVNCIVVRNGEMHGYNTDYIGFLKSLQNKTKQQLELAFILGSGGSSKAVQYACNQIGLPYFIVSRTVRSKTLRHITYNDVARYFQPKSLIVNTTPAGMFPDIHAIPPFPLELLGADDVVFDLIYNPSQTAFMMKAAHNGATVFNGYEMLTIQAEESWKIWNG